MIFLNSINHFPRLVHSSHAEKFSCLLSWFILKLSIAGQEGNME